MTKMLEVNIKLFIHAPDDWEIHKTSEATEVIKLPNGQYMDMTFTPMLAQDPEQEWTTEGTDELTEELLDLVDYEEVTFEFVGH